MNKLVDYKRGILPVGQVIASLPTFVGNEYNGWRTQELALQAPDGAVWVCYPQTTDDRDFCSFLLNDESPRFVKETAKKLGV